MIREKFIKIIFRGSENPHQNESSTKSKSTFKSKNTFEQDIYFTANFQVKAKEWGLTEEHARLVYYEGDTVKGKENMKIATYKGEEIGIYVFHDRLTNQPGVTSIWRRTPRPVAPAHLVTT